MCRSLLESVLRLTLRESYFEPFVWEGVFVLYVVQ